MNFIFSLVCFPEIFVAKQAALSRCRRFAVILQKKDAIYLPDANLVLQNVEEEDEVVLHLATGKRAAARFHARWP
jgi:hypothetical protein